MGRLTTHVLDAAHGCPGSAIKVELYRVEGAQLELVATAQTNSDGRCDAPCCKVMTTAAVSISCSSVRATTTALEACNCRSLRFLMWWSCGSASAPSRTTITSHC